MTALGMMPMMFQHSVFEPSRVGMVTSLDDWVDGMCIYQTFQEGLIVASHKTSFTSRV